MCALINECMYLNNMFIITQAAAFSGGHFIIQSLVKIRSTKFLKGAVFVRAYYKIKLRTLRNTAYIS